MVIILIFLFNYGSFSGNIYDYGLTPRSLALGKSFVGLADDGEAGYFNPAGLSYQNRMELKIAYSQLYGSNLEYLNYTLPTDKYGTYAITFLSLNAFDIESRTIKNELSKSTFFAENVYLLSHGYPLFPFLSIGSNLKIHTKNIFIYSDVGIGFDLALYLSCFYPYTFGITLTNLISPNFTLYSEKETYKKILKIGNCYRAYKERVKILLDLNLLEDIFQEFSYDYLNPHFGIEFEIAENRVVQRIGLDRNELSLGIGLKNVGKNFSLDIDYAFLLHYQSKYLLSPTHKIGLTFKFGGFHIWAKAFPKYFSPKPESKENLLTINIKYATKGKIKRWQFLIRSELGEIVKTYQGYDEIPTKLFWDGLDDIGRPVADGKYYYEVTLIDTEEKISLHNTGYLTTIKTTGLKGEVKIK